MPYIPLSKQRQPFSSFALGSIARKKRETDIKKKSSVDLSDIDQLKTFAESKGLEVKEKKPSLFFRAMDAISRPLYASAGAAKAITKRVKTGTWEENPLIEAWKGLKGEDKETYSDVLEEAGVENKWVRGGAGFALDIALDPTTYLGGTLAKGAGKTAKITSRIGLKGLAKVSPRKARALTAVGTSLKEALGHAFVYGFGTSRGLSDDVARYFNKLGIGKDKIVTQNINALKGFNKNVLDDAVDLMFKNKELERQVKEGLIEVPKYFKGKGKVSDAMQEMGKIGTRIGEMTGMPTEKLYKNYIPSIIKMKERFIAEAPAGLKVGKEGYKRLYKGLIKDEDLLKKPFELWTRREYEVFKNNLTRETLTDVVTKWGKSADEFTKLDDAAKALYQPIKEKQFGKVIGYLKEADSKFMNDYLFPEFKTIDLLAKATGYDKFTNWFKTAVTAYFPAFHVRNYISGNVQNYSTLGREAFNPLNHTSALKMLKGKAGKIGKYSNVEIKKAMDETFSGTSRYIADIGDHIDELIDGSFKLKKISKARNVGNFIETNQKAVAVATALNQGSDLKSALKLAEQAGFDYTKITKFEQKILKRVMPFYTFARKNAELQLRTIAKHPERMLNQAKFAKAMSTVFGGKMTEEDMKGVPGWALEGLGFKIDGNKYLTKFGLPVEEFLERINKPIMQQLSSLNPIIKFPVESKLGYDFFREQQIKDIKKISPQLVKILPDSLKEKMSVQEREYEGKKYYYADPRYLHFLRNLPTSRLQNTLEKMTEGDLPVVEKLLAFFSGAKIYDIDLDLQKYFTERDIRTDLEDELMMKGEIAEFKRTFIPKDKR